MLSSNSILRSTTNQITIPMLPRRTLHISLDKSQVVTKREFMKGSMRPLNFLFQTSRRDLRSWRRSWKSSGGTGRRRRSSASYLAGNSRRLARNWKSLETPPPLRDKRNEKEAGGHVLGPRPWEKGAYCLHFQLGKRK